MIDAQAALAQVREALEAGPTPGPWRVVQHVGYCVDEVITDHPDWQEKPNGNFVAEVSLAAGHEKHGQLFERTAAFIAKCNPENMRAILAHVEAQAAEISDLRSDLESYIAAANGYLADVEAQKAENERLKRVGIRAVIALAAATDQMPVFAADYAAVSDALKEQR